MQCISPRKLSFDREGNKTYSSRKALPGLLPIIHPCGKCLPCRLLKAKEKAIRCVHEAKMHEKNIFLTLTYNNENLSSPRLVLQDMDLFLKRLREHINREATTDDEKKALTISYMYTGEYGEESKRPHWHIIIFNYEPSDKRFPDHRKHQDDLGNLIWTSDTLTKLWKKGTIEFGAVTFESAGYVARYAAKKLIHGHDQDHDYHPIHNTSKGRAIGRTWIEKHFKHTFENGFVVINEKQAKIPRYYVDWAKKHQTKLWKSYVTQTRPIIEKQAELKARREEIEHFNQIFNGNPLKLTKSQVKHTILKQKFKLLQEKLKL